MVLLHWHNGSSFAVFLLNVGSRKPRSGLRFRRIPLLLFVCWRARCNGYLYPLAFGFVSLQNVLSVVSDTAVFTDKWSIYINKQVNLTLLPYDKNYLPHIVVSPEMIHHVAFGSEAQPALLRAGEWSWVEVNQHVSFQILFLRERFIAVRNRTLERLSAEMHVHMSPVSIQSPKWLVTLLACVFADRFFLSASWFGLLVLNLTKLTVRLILFGQGIYRLRFVWLLFFRVQLGKPLMIFLLLIERRKIL